MTINSIFSYAGILFIGYLLGSFPSGYLAGRWLSGIDIRELGSGSTGTTNVLRYVGKKAAIGVFLLDVIKGIAAILIARTFLAGDQWQVATGLSALVGHIWPVWLQWKGGKAVATGLGVLIGISWPVGAACFGVFLTVLSITKIVSLSSIIASLCLPILMAISFKFSQFSGAYMSVSLMAMAIVLWRHRSNFKRILKGIEPRIGSSSKG